mmetsp:Transcript_25191/g.27927  ORF Transcript_25191/g.27927 Transcript_25191/m.27927 type:complete len:252 (+) Transcript_25191:50-805(+)
MAGKSAEDMHTARVFMICLPFLFALMIYPLIYIFLIRRYSPTKLAMVKKFQVGNKVIAALIVLLLIPPLLYGSFEQTYLRTAITLVAIVLTFFSEEHFFIRLVGVFMHIIVVNLLEYFYWKELTMQVGCWGQGSCAGRTDFENLKLLGTLGINNGLLLQGAHMSFSWAAGLYARGIFAIIIHYIAILNIMTQCVWVGFFTNIKVERKMEIITTRPDEDIVSIFTTFKQSSFFSVYQKYKKRGGENDSKTCC